MKEKTMEERYADDLLTNNKVMKHFRQCKDCKFRYKDFFEFDGKEYPCSEEDGWKKGCCHIYFYPQSKPDYVFDNTSKCESYEKE